MEQKTRAEFLRKLIFPDLVVVLLGLAAAITGVVLLAQRNFLAGGLVAGGGVIAIVFGILFGLWIVFSIDRAARARARAISEDAYFLQDDFFISFTERGIGIVAEKDGEDLPCVPYGETAVWKYYSYSRPNGVGKIKYTLRFPTRYLPAALDKIDRTRENVFMDIDEARFPATLARYGVAVQDLADPLEDRSEKMAEYGDIAVYDNGVYLTHMWTRDKRRFLPWEDVLTVSHEEDELVFDCGYERFHTRFHAGFFRDLAANYPDKLAKDSVPEEDGGEEGPSDGSGS